MDQQVQSAAQGADEAEEGGLDLEAIKGYVAFVRASIGRRKGLFFSTLIGVGALAYAVYWLVPRSYHVELQLYAQKNAAMFNVLSNNRDQDSPTRAAAETVLRRDNLVALVQKADMIANWDRSRSHAAVLKDWIRARLGKVTSEQDKLDIIVGTLEDKLTVTTKSDNSGEGTVTIAIDWQDARMAYRLVTAAHQSFLEARQLSETTSLSEALSILIARANTLGRELEATAKALQDRRAEQQVGRRHVAVDGEKRGGRPAVPEISAANTGASDREAALQIQTQWEAKKAAIRDIEDMRRHRIAELQAKLAELRAVYADSHPAIVDTVQAIETLSGEDSPQLAQLRKDETALRNQYLTMTARSADVPGETLTQHLLRPVSSIRATAEPASNDDRETEFTKEQLRVRAEAYDNLLTRIEGARMEMETARAAFKYRYIVIHPAQLPRQAKSPDPKKFAPGGVIAALVFALLAAVGADLRSGRVYAAWQLERALRLPVLAELRQDR